MIAPGALGVPRGGSTRLPAEWGCPPPSQLPARSERFSCSPLSIYSALQRTSIMYYAYLLDVLLAPRASTALNLAPRSSSCPSPPPATPEHALSFRTNGGENHRFLHLHNPICCTQPGVEPKPVQHTKVERQQEPFARSSALKIFSRGACGCLLTRLIDLRHRAAVWRRQLKRLPPLREAWRSGKSHARLWARPPPQTSSHCDLAS